MSAIHVSGLRKVYSKPLAGRVISRIDSWFRLASRLALRLPREEVVALDGIDLNIKQGEFFGLLGPNGAGKTTLIKILCGIVPPDEGEILVNGYDVVKERDKVKASVSFVAGGKWIGFDYALTLKENLHLYGLLNGLSLAEARARTKESLDLVGLAEKADEPATFAKLQTGTSLSPCSPMM